MPETTYNFSIAGDMPGGAVNEAKLVAEIQAAAITRALDGVSVNGDVLAITFKDALTVGDETILHGDTSNPAGGLLAAHDNSPSEPETQQVEITNPPLAREDGVIYAVPKPSGFNMVMCDRDIRINTCIVDPAAALEDLKVDTQTNKEVDWGEMVLTGVFKLSGADMVACVDQADADANGVLTAWDYHARAGGNPIKYEVRDGLLYVDPTLPANEVWAHRAYAVVAPAIPAALGGSVIVFDAYLGANPNNLVEALSPQATVLDPTGPAGAAASTLRLYVFHPAGSKLSHVLRLVTYRAPGTY